MAKADPLVSIITPTFGRAQWLPLIHKCILSQDLTDLEWLVLDDSSEPSDFMRSLEGDRRVRYLHHPEKLTIGTKRNILIDQARSKIVAQFDDDDYYADHYLSRMMSILEEEAADFVKLFGFFLFSKCHDMFAYWDMTAKHGLHFRLHSDKPIRSLVATEKESPFARSMHLGFGFSYVFRKKVWASAQFADANWSEETPLIRNAVQHFRLVGIQDSACSCLHILHEANSSACWPQYILPRFLLDTLFPNASRQVENRGRAPKQRQLTGLSAE